VQIGDPIRGATWRVVLKHYRPISPLLILWQSRKGRHTDVDSWKTVHPSAKVTKEG